MDIFILQSCRCSFILVVMFGIKIGLMMFLAMASFAQDQGAQVSQEQKDIEELQQARQEQQAMPELRFDPSKIPAQLQWIVPHLEKPEVQARARAVFQLTQDSTMQAHMTSVSKNPNLKWMYVGFAVVTFLFMLLRSRVLAATDRWYMRLFLRLLLTPVLMGGLLLVSYGVLGQSLVELSLALFKVLRGA